MRIPYFPGCTLYTKAKNFDQSARAAALALGIEMVELSDWTCCGTCFPLISENLMGLLAPVRVLATAEREGDRLLTLCSFCFNTLKRANHVVRNDPEKREKLNRFLEMDYDGKVEVVHLVQVLRDELGFDAVKERVAVPLEGLRVAPYYGCLLLRPQAELDLDDAEEPKVLEDLLTALGAEPVDFRQKTECCGSFLVVQEPSVPAVRGAHILRGAREAGAEVLVTSCPLCQYNIDQTQRELAGHNGEAETIPVLYFTQLLGLALGVPVEELAFDRHYADPSPVVDRFAASPHNPVAI